MAIRYVQALLAPSIAQMVKEMYREGQHEMNQRAAVWSAISLYLDFINLMLHLLRFVGVKKD